MAKGQHLSAHQQGIVKRYYDNADTIALNKLGELVSELYLCTDAKKAEKYWKQAETALAKTGLDPVKVRAVMISKSPEHLARLVAELSPGGKATRR